MIDGRFENVELYDKRFDWIAAALLAIPLVWLFYGFDAAFVSMLAFMLVGGLKPLVNRLGSRLAAGVFAAGLILLLSPFLRFVFYKGYCFEGSWSVAAGISSYVMPNLCRRELFADFGQDLWVGPLRDITMPFFGIGLFLLVAVRPTLRQAVGSEDFTEAANASTQFRQAILRWSGISLALLAWICGSYVNYRAKQAELEAQQVAEMVERVRQEKETEVEARRIAAEQAAKRVDRTFLLGSWASVENGSSDPKIYCATDAGFIFKKDGRYSGDAAEGTFSIKENDLLLFDRTSFDMEEIGEPPKHLDPETLTIERSGNRLIIEGVTYGRC